jgi:HD-like signal output (HDOD) protein
VILKRFSNLLRNLFKSNARPKDDEAAAVSARLERRVLALVDNMPTLPDTATRAMALANDPDSRFVDLARIIEGDAAIATGLLRFANSAFYAGGSPALKLHQAVVRLGMQQCKNLIVGIGMRSLFQRIPAEIKSQCEELWHHGYVTGSVCRQINRAYRLGFEGEEFSAGLLHDLGRILLLLADPECFARAGALDFREEGDILERERTAIGIDHCALGGWFGEHSKLPDSLIQTMKLHHQPELAEQSDKLVALVATADHMANYLQREEALEEYNPEDNPGLPYLWARWPEARKGRFLGDIPSLLEESLRAAASEKAAC